jgi:hypothetical protein
LRLECWPLHHWCGMKPPSTTLEIGMLTFTSLMWWYETTIYHTWDGNVYPYTTDVVVWNHHLPHVKVSIPISSVVDGGFIPHQWCKGQHSNLKCGRWWFHTTTSVV